MKHSIFAALTAMLLLCGCAAAPAETAPSAPATAEVAAPAPVEAAGLPYTDALGRTVLLPQHPQRVACLIGSFADIWYLAGGQQSLVAAADDTWTSFDLAPDDSVINLGAVKEPSAEKLLAAAPELVLASTNTQADLDLRPVLEQAGVPVAYFDVSHFTDYLAMLKTCTELTGCAENYTRYGTAVAKQIDAAKAAVTGPAPRVLYLRASASGVKVKNSEGSVLGEMLADLGCVNIADSDTSLLENLSLEAILADNPDKIFIVLQGANEAEPKARLEADLLGNPAWQQLTAVQNGQVYYMEHRLYNLKPNDQWGAAYEKLAQILYGT